ncbi:MAG: sarcosine oxidase subunit alpha family protein [Sneathiella sp.]|nr:sarcosine oxidase subunit alpha family protein [Sneathiella sp.]
MSTDRQKLRIGGGLVDRGKPVTFRFDGRVLKGFAGDTLASALLANGRHLVGRSFKYHRPRGIFAAGVEEPNALVELGAEDRLTPNVQATAQELYEGLQAKSQNRWPSLRFDLMAVNNLFSRFLTAGFYYKTFMWPAGAWEFYEKFIRRAAGMGKGTHLPDPDTYEHVHDHADIAVVGSGPAGLSAALTAAEAGKDVLLIEQDFELGGTLLYEAGEIAGQANADWRRQTIARINGEPKIRVLTRTTAFGYYENNILGCVERVQDHVLTPDPHVPRQRLRHVRAEKVILATGAFERPFVFGNNDLPGILLSSAAEAYVNRYAVLPGEKMVLYTNQESGYRVAASLLERGIRLAAIIDARSPVPTRHHHFAREAGIPLYPAHEVAEAKGGLHLKGLVIRKIGDGLEPRDIRLDCDTLIQSAGWAPVLHLQSQRGIKPVYHAALDSYLPGKCADGQHACAGAAAGYPTSEDAAVHGHKVARYLIGAAKTAPRLYAPKDAPPPSPAPVPLTRAKCFVDLQHDVTRSDIEQGVREGFRSPEHIKRYTTQGMAADQGKTGNINTLKILSQVQDKEQSGVGTTTFRPPYTPLTIGAVAGRSIAGELRPTRLSPFHDCHVRAGAEFITAGDWLRPWYYPGPGEDVTAAYIREAGEVRSGVGMVDVSTLGKIDIQGPDAAEFLNRVYVNGWKTLPVGKARYGLMLRDDGMVMDDGTTWRLGEHHYFMTTTTTGAGAVMRHLEYLLQIDWPELKVHLTSVSDEWGGVAIAGPRSRAVLGSSFPGVDVSTEAIPHMGVLEFDHEGLPVRICRLSFSGELAFEVYTRAGFAGNLWDLLTEGGKPHDLRLYGSEALGALRIEKGHVAGPELDGRTTADDLGLGGMQSTKKAYVGSVLKNREGLIRNDRRQLAGLKPVEGDTPLKAGMLLFEGDGITPKGHGIGHVTSVTYSPELKRHIALALLAEGRERVGTLIRAVDNGGATVIDVKVCSPHFIDPEGERLHA